MRGRGPFFRKAPSLALPPGKTTVRRFWGRGRFSERSASPPDPLSRRAVGNRLGSSFGGSRPCEVGAFPCFGVVVTAADRAAATCLRLFSIQSISWGRRGGGGDRKAARRAPSPSPARRPESPLAPSAEGAVMRVCAHDGGYSPATTYRIVALFPPPRLQSRKVSFLTLRKLLQCLDKARRLVFNLNVMLPRRMKEKGGRACP